MVTEIILKAAEATRIKGSVAVEHIVLKLFTLMNLIFSELNM